MRQEGKTESHAAVAVTKKANDRDNNSEDDMAMPAPTASDSEDEPIMSSRVAASGCGATSQQRKAEAVQLDFHPPVASGMAQTKDRGRSPEKQRARKSVPAEPSFGLFLVGNMDEPAVGNVSPAAASAPSGRGRAPAKSTQDTGYSSSSSPRTAPSAEAKSPRPSAGRRGKAGDAKDGDEPSVRKAGRFSPKNTETPPNAFGAGTKTTSRRATNSAYKPKCDTGKRTEFQTLGRASLRSRILAAGEEKPTPGKKNPVGRRFSLDGRAARPSSASTPVRKRRASVAGTLTETSPGEGSVASRAKVWKRAMEAEQPSASKSRNPSRGSPKTTARGERGGGPSSTGTESNTPKGRTPGTANMSVRSSDDYYKGGGRPSGGGGAGVKGVDDTASTETRPTHKKKVWHAGRPSTMFGLARERKAEIEVLWDVKIWRTGETVRVE